MQKQLLKIKLWNARRKLRAAAEHEADMRRSAKYVAEVILPRLENEVRALEIDISLLGYWERSK